jgi:hypothetical protein
MIQKKRRLEDIIGIIEIDKTVDAQELKDSIHFKKELY